MENEAPAKPAGLYETREVDVAPQIRVPKAPHYPSELRKAGINGETLLMFTVRADGSVADVTILETTDKRFGDASVESILTWRYKPAILKGHAVDCRVTQKLVFTPVDN